MTTVLPVAASVSPVAPSARRTIGMLLEDFTRTNRMREVWNGVREAARAHAVNVWCFPAGDLANTAAAQTNPGRGLCDLIHPETLQGLVTFQWWRGREEFERICGPYHPLPIINVLRAYDGYPAVIIDDYASMRNVLEHLVVVHGYRRIAYIKGYAGHLSARERYRAYVDLLADYGLAYRAELVAAEQVNDAGKSYGREGARLLFRERGLRPTQDVEAIVTFNDEIALAVIEVLQELGICVPDDVAVVGFDDLTAARFSAPPLTTAAVSWHDLGRQAVNLLAALLNGESVPPVVKLTAPVAVRRSCGCFEPVVAHAAARTDRPACPPVSPELSERPDVIRDAMTQIMKTGQRLAPGWETLLIEACARDLQATSAASPSPPEFLGVLEAMVMRSVDPETDQDFWHEALSVLRRHFCAALAQDAERLAAAEDLWQQARVLVGALARRAWLRQHAETDRQAEVLRQIGQRLISTFNVTGIMHILAEELPRLPISRCYLAVYDHPPAPDGSARLILAYDRRTPADEIHLPPTGIAHAAATGRFDLPADGLRFAARHILPPALRPLHNRYHLVVEPLYFGDRPLGFACFEADVPDGRIYDILRGEISSALQGALLVEQIQGQFAELTRQKYILDTFMATVPDRIYFKDRDSRVMQANRAYALRFGLRDPAEMPGTSDADFLTGAEAQLRHAQELAIMRTGEPLVGVEEFDQSGHWTLTTKMPLRNEHGEIIGIFGISRDITAQKQAQAELAQYRDHLEDLITERTAEITRINALLHQQILERVRIEDALRLGEQQYRLLAESVQYGIAILQADKLVFVNAVLTGLVGAPPDQLLSRDPLALFPAHALPLAQERLRQDNDAVSTGSKWQTDLATRDGRSLWVEITCRPIVWNSLPAQLLTVQNITDRKLREQRLEQERARLEQENLTLKSAIKERYRFGELVGKSPAMQRVYELIISAAASGVNVLLAGESGTGKELIARMLHQVSPRKAQAFVPVNCASIPDTLFEREFFGHRKGAFTGADRDKTGFFDLAHKGTLFLDEVTELTPGAQAKLLRVLQDGQYTPLGSPLAKQADVVVIAATNQDCRAEMAAGRLRKDFFYRIGVIEITVPPLRERKEDVPLLIEHILAHYRQKQLDMHGQLPPGVPTDQTMLPGELVQALYAYAWPGNIRELQNVLQRYLATADLGGVRVLLANADSGRALPEPELDPRGIILPDVVQSLEKQIIADTLARHQYRTRVAAQKLGIPLRTLQGKIQKYGLRHDD